MPNIDACLIQSRSTLWLTNPQELLVRALHHAKRISALAQPQRPMDSGHRDPPRHSHPCAARSDLQIARHLQTRLASFRWEQAPLKRRASVQLPHLHDPLE